MSNSISNNPRAAVTALATGLESLASLIKEETLQRICIIVAPAIALVLKFSFNLIIKSIEYRKGLKTYGVMIADYEEELKRPDIATDRKKF